MKIVIQFARNAVYSSEKSGNLATKVQKNYLKITLDPRHFTLDPRQYILDPRHSTLDPRQKPTLENQLFS